MAKVYLEASFISACVTQRSDAASVYRRATSLEWWQIQRGEHELFISHEVLEELSHPEFRHRLEALSFVNEVPLLEIDDEVLALAELLIREKVMPVAVGGDSVHVAVVTLHGMEYLLSLNVRHLANRNKLTHLHTICRRAGLVPPQILTPDLLWESEK